MAASAAWSHSTPGRAGWAQRRPGCAIRVGECANAPTRWLARIPGETVNVAVVSLRTAVETAVRYRSCAARVRFAAAVADPLRRSSAGNGSAFAPKTWHSAAASARVEFTRTSVEHSGFEPLTPCLPGKCSPAELMPREPRDCTESRG